MIKKMLLIIAAIISIANPLFCAQPDSQPKARSSLKRLLMVSSMAVTSALGPLQPFAKQEIWNSGAPNDMCQPYQFPKLYVEHLTPPPLITADTTEHHCDRPKRTEGIKIAVGKQNDKTIVDCYGHGGAGYVTLFGSVEKAINLLQTTKPAQTTPIRIIGSGCMGLTMATELRRLGFSNIKIVTKERYDIPSWRAGGFFDPGTGLESTAQEKEQLKLSLDTFQTYRLIEQGRHPYLSKKVVKRYPLYSGAHVESGVEVLESLGYMPAREYVSLDFGNGVRHENYRKFHTYFIDVTQVMKQLWAEVNRLGISVEQQEVASLADVQEPIVVNCAGLGAGKLNNDSAVYPSRGHFFMLPQTDEQLDYMFFDKVEQGGKQEYLYYFPKGQLVSSAHKEGRPFSGMVGGTFLPRVDRLEKDEQRELHATELKKLTERANKFFRGKNGSLSNSTTVSDKIRKEQLRAALKQKIAQKKEARTSRR